MHHFLELLKNGHKNCIVRYSDVFEENSPNANVIVGFRERTGIDITQLEWQYNGDFVAEIVEKEFEPLLKKIATILHSFDCDIVLLSGRPASLPTIREIFLKYYTVAPNRLITLNNYYVGDWYPFGNNTGCITNPKTIVAMGGIIGHYASTLSNFDKFVIDLSKLKANLKSTVNFIEASREWQPIEYCISPQKVQGELTISSLPTNLRVRQIGLDSYPSRTLYTIDFNRHKLGDRIRRKAFNENNVSLTDGKVAAEVSSVVDNLKKKMPFRISIARNEEDKEALSIISISDGDDNEIADGSIEIHLKSLGAEESYWLDSGAFNF